MIQIATPEQLQAAKKPEGAITFWVIYDRPKDFPDGYVLRAQWATKGGITASQEAWYSKTIDNLHSLLPMWALTRMGPYPGDDPCIAEVWME
jgi:hypothetical protein